MLWLSLLFRTWFSVSAPVGRRVYAASGFGLMALKYVLDAGAVFAVTGKQWTPIAYLSPLLSMREAELRPAPHSLLLAMAIWALPFLWIGLTMTMRRAVDAGRSPWTGLLYFVPLLNYAWMVALCLLPSKPRHPAERRLPLVGNTLRSALFGVAISTALGLGVLLLSVTVLGSYGSALFLGAPVLVGAVSSYALNREGPQSLGRSISAALAALVLTCGASLLFALEGVVCITMAFPIGAAGAVLGAVIGRAIARQSSPPAAVVQLLLVGLALPLLSASEPVERALAPRHEVVSSVEVEAPPEMVWPNVIAFGDLPPPPELMFRAGISYPMRASITGHGVGAVRRCEFSTGAFVEPITAWEPPRRLSFDVASQPPPMAEWSPYRHVHPPHLDGYFRSVRGEFRLVPLPGGRTRLEGSTWYELDLAPAPYWGLWADALVHAIHLRVLEQIKLRSERAPSAGSGVGP
ncbi:MAG TPA: SRPBCC family protein [Myxococcaceae bacterium]|nr:SRPBCC family protein [Myxococcaceae bacterium]